MTSSSTSSQGWTPWRLTRRTRSLPVVEPKGVASGGVQPASLQGAQGLVCYQLAVAATVRGPVLAQVQAHLQAGQLTAILGPNGAGKSTLLSVLMGLRAPRSGQVLLDGLPVYGASDTLARRLAVMPQETQVAFAFTAAEVVEMGRYPHRAEPAPDEQNLVQQAMEATGVVHLAGRSVASLSGGERARVHLARALVQLWHPLSNGKARWLLLDEPTAALDVQHQHLAMELLRHRAEDGWGVVAVLHDLNLALRYAHQVLLIPGQGESALLGPVDEVLTAERIREIWQVEGECVTAADGVSQFLFRGCTTRGVAQG